MENLFKMAVVYQDHFTQIRLSKICGNYVFLYSEYTQDSLGGDRVGVTSFKICETEMSKAERETLDDILNN